MRSFIIQFDDAVYFPKEGNASDHIKHDLEKTFKILSVIEASPSIGLANPVSFSAGCTDVQRMRDVQGSALATSKDPYMLGIYNGLELASAILEGRPPVYKKLEQKDTSK